MKYLRFPGLMAVTVFCISAGAQSVAGFEEFGLPRGEKINNAHPESAFSSGTIELPNFYDPAFDFWSGWAITADTNTTTPGFFNQYSSIAGRGALGTTAYAIGYIFDPVTIRLKPGVAGKSMIGMYVSNSTYAYLSMRDGDFFSKKFGGETGDDPDFFKLTIRKYAGGVIDDDSLEIYLSDYRFSQPGKDYILSDWVYIDLSELGEVDSLLLSLSSSDVGIFGMNTPAYVCIDQVSTDNLLAASAAGNTGRKLTITPNPARDRVWLHLPRNGRVNFVNLQGTAVWSRSLEAGMREADISGLAPGIYFVSLDGVVAAKIFVE